MGFGEVFVDGFEGGAEGWGGGWSEGGKGWEGDVNAFEEGMFGGVESDWVGGGGPTHRGRAAMNGARKRLGRGTGDAGRDEGVAGVEGAGGGEADAGADLGLLEGEAFAGELDVGVAVHAEGGGLFAFVDLDGGYGFFGGVLVGDVVVEASGDGLAGGVVEHAFRGDAGEGDAGVDLEWRPGGQAHFREDLGVGGGEEGLLADLAGDLVLAVAVRGAAYEDCREDQWPVEADGSDGIVEDAVVGPLGEGLFLGLGEAEVDFRAEELVDAEVAVGGEELLGADETEGVVEVCGHEVLAAFAAGKGEVGDARALAA